MERLSETSFTLIQLHNGPNIVKILPYGSVSQIRAAPQWFSQGHGDFSGAFPLPSRTLNHKSVEEQNDIREVLHLALDNALTNWNAKLEENC